MMVEVIFGTILICIIWSGYTQQTKAGKQTMRRPAIFTTIAVVLIIGSNGIFL